MKMDLVTSIKNSGTVFVPSTAWLTLEHGSYVLTSPSPMELRPTYIQYKQFRVGPVQKNYRLSLSGFEGITPTDPFTTYNIIGYPFSTVDRLNYLTCAHSANGSNSPGGWWYKICFRINLNYNYNGSDGFVYLDSKWYSPSFIEMKIRPTTCDV